MTDRPLLSSEDNAALRDWQNQHLRLTWAEHPRPWQIEKDVINKLAPPLNLAGNTSHPFHQTLSDARTSFKNAAQPTGDGERSSVTHRIMRNRGGQPGGQAHPAQRDRRHPQREQERFVTMIEVDPV